MAEPPSLPKQEEQPRRFFQQPEARAEFVRRLEQELLARALHIRPDRRRTGRVRALRWAVVALLVTLVVGVLVVGPANLAAAMQRLLGYIPGIGLVQESGGLPVLAEPVSQARGGITVTIEQAVADSERTIVVMTVDGIPPEAHPRSESAVTCSQNPELVLPEAEEAALLSARGDDSRKESETVGRGDMVSGGGQGWGSGYSWRMVFAALPSHIDRATLHIPCLFDTADHHRAGCDGHAAGGPYKFVRHPADAAGVLTAISTPILLGSWWVLPLGLLDAVLTIARTHHGDRTLQAELPGYTDYSHRVRYRLVPGIWRGADPRHVRASTREESDEIPGPPTGSRAEVCSRSAGGIPQPAEG